MNRGHGGAKQILQQAGAKQIFNSRWTSVPPDGTVRINEPVDANLQTEYENLYVRDCSVIPEPWALNSPLVL